MKFILFFLVLISVKNFTLANETSSFKNDNLQAIYHLDNGNKIYIEQYERGDRIWEKNIILIK